MYLLSQQIPTNATSPAAGISRITAAVQIVDILAQLFPNYLPTFSNPDTTIIRTTAPVGAIKIKATLGYGFDFIDLPCLVYFFPFLLAFFASSACFATKRFGDLYGRLDVFLFGLNAIIRVMATSI